MRIEEIILKLNNFYKGGVEIDPETSRDQVLYGQTDVECTGIVTTIWANVAVIEKAHQLGANLIICHEALFWNHGDHQDYFEKNHLETFLIKRKLLDDYGITVWRAHDYPHSGMPIGNGQYSDAIFFGLAKKLGWEKYIIGDTSSPQLFEIPEMTAEELAMFLIDRLHLNGIRVIGDKRTVVRKIKVPLHVFMDANEDIQQIEQENFDAILPLEMVDYSLAEYIKDASLLGRNKVSLSLGHFNLEEPGMEYMAEYLSKIIGNDIFVSFVQAGDTYDYIVKEGKS